jgi:hypothetical protein
MYEMQGPRLVAIRAARRLLGLLLVGDRYRLVRSRRDGLRCRISPRHPGLLPGQNLSWPWRISIAY